MKNLFLLSLIVFSFTACSNLSKDNYRSISSEASEDTINRTSGFGVPDKMQF